MSLDISYIDASSKVYKLNVKELHVVPEPQVPNPWSIRIIFKSEMAL